MKLYVTRHGQTQWNQDNLICGVSDIELNENGIQQARQLASSLKEYSINEIYSSPLIRARTTAEIVSKELQIPVMIDQRLFEQDYGIYEGTLRGTEEFLELKSSLHILVRIMNLFFILLRGFIIFWMI